MTDGLVEMRYRRAISQFATGVAVITTSIPGGLAGMTASAVTSLSLDPVQLLVCVGNTLLTRSAIAEHGRFAVNVLGADGEYLARRFASRKPDKFAGISVNLDYGVPVLRDAIAHFVCDLATTVPGGDHTIFIGDVVHCDSRAEADPLLYFGSNFGGLCDPEAHLRLSYDRQFYDMAN
jgi:flavin reductase (DIM6/NTAB) family NADH-FMN oxidoreductase RutF